MPVGFERYGRILHPAWAASGAPVRWDAVGRWSGRTVHALERWELLARPPGEAPPACPFVEPPRKSALPPHVLATLCNLLATTTSTPDRCRFATWEGYGWQHGRIHRRRPEGSTSPGDLVSKLPSPRIVWLVVPAAAVDASLDQLTPHLVDGEIVVDGGNSYYVDDIRRSKALGGTGVDYLDCGTSGGSGALNAATA